MKQGCRLLIALTLLLLLLSSCNDKSENLKLAACGSYAVPGMICHDLKGGTFTCNVVDTDSYGRILFLYETTNIITGNKEKAYVICQEIDSRYVYFYEGVCYDSLADGSANVDQLKTVNDWDNPFQKQLMSKRTHQISFDLFLMVDSAIDYNDAQSAACAALDIQEDQIIAFYILDANPAGQSLFLLLADNNNQEERFFVIVKEDYSVFWTRVDDLFQTDIYTFKQKSGWTFIG